MKLRKTIWILFFTNFIHAQEFKNFLEFGIHQPLRTLSMGEYYNDDWYYISYPSSTPNEVLFTRKHYDVGFNLNYGRKLNNMSMIKLGVFIGTRQINETYFADYHSQQDAGSDDWITTQDYTYNRKQLGFTLGMHRDINLTNQFLLRFGLNIMYFRNFTSNSVLNAETDMFINNELLFQRHEIIISNQWGAFTFIGLGPEVSVEYSFSKRIHVVLGAQNYFTVLLVSQPKLFNYFRRSETYIPDYSLDEFENTWIEKTSVRAFDFTTISPFFRLQYSF